MTFQEIIESIEELSDEDQDLLFELIRKRRIAARRAEIVALAQEVFEAVETGTAQQGNFENIRDYLLSDDTGYRK